MGTCVGQISLLASSALRMVGERRLSKLYDCSSLDRESEKMFRFGGCRLHRRAAGSLRGASKSGLLNRDLVLIGMADGVDAFGAGGGDDVVLGAEGRPRIRWVRSGATDGGGGGGDADAAAEIGGK